MRCVWTGLILMLSLAGLASVAAYASDGGWTPFAFDDGVVQFKAHVWRRPVQVTLGSASPSSSVRESFVQDVLADTDEPAAKGEPGEPGALPPLPRVPLLIESRRIALPEVYRVAFGSNSDLHAGRSFFSGVIVQLDYPNARLRVLDQDALDLRRLANVPARRVDARIGTHVRLEVDGEPVWAALATEYSGAMMVPRSLATRLGWLDQAMREMGSVQDHRGREVVIEGLRLDAVQFGPFRISDVEVVLMEDGDSPLPGDYSQDTAIVGNEMLKHFQLSIDLDRARLHAQPL